jgi:hypothetical protein
MFARNVSIRLKPNMLSDYTQAFEKEVLPLLHKQKGFKDEITFAGTGGVDVTAISLAKVERKSRWARQCAAENGDRHALACRPHRQ